MAEQLAIIREVRIGCGDRGFPTLRFSTYTSEGVAAGQHLSWKDAEAVMAHVSDVSELNGRACWVEVEGNIVRFLRLADI